VTPLSKKARIAGLLYLGLVLLGPLRLIYIPTHLIVDGNAAATAANITEHAMLFQLGIVGDLVGGVLLIYFTLALWQLFKDVDPKQAMTVVILGGVMPGAIYFFNVLNDIAALTLIRGTAYLSVFDQPQRDALAMLFLHLHDQEIVAAEVFWGLWLFPLAILVFRSRWFPRFLGVWLIIAGVSYLALSFAGLLFPQYQDLVFRIGRPARLGELAFTLWLLVMGAKAPPEAPPEARQGVTR
jgi:hypothetical protein